MLTIFSGYILPLLYGLLGTLVGAFRSIQDKVRNGQLGPRDLGLTLTGLMLGSVAGLVVGILMNLNSFAAGNDNALGNVSLTASGLAFLAGYASQSFFRFIDSVVAKVFPADVPETPTSVAAPPVSPRVAGGPGGSGQPPTGTEPPAGSQPPSGSGRGNQSPTDAAPQAGSQPPGGPGGSNQPPSTAAPPASSQPPGGPGGGNQPPTVAAPPAGP